MDTRRSSEVSLVPARFKTVLADRRPPRVLMIVMYRAEHNKVTNVWADIDKEGLGNQRGATLDDVLSSRQHDALLNPTPRENLGSASRRSGHRGCSGCSEAPRNAVGPAHQFLARWTGCQP